MGLIIGNKIAAGSEGYDLTFDATLKVVVASDSVIDFVAASVSTASNSHDDKQVPSVAAVRSYIATVVLDAIGSQY